MDLLTALVLALGTMILVTCQCQADKTETPRSSVMTCDCDTRDITVCGRMHSKKT